MRCYHLLCSPIGLTLFLAQLDCLDQGMDYLVDDLAQFVKDEERTNDGIDKKVLATLLKQKIQVKIEETVTLKSTSSVRNIVQKRNELMREFFSGRIASMKKCVHCQSKKIGVNLQDNLVLVVSKKVVDVPDTDILAKNVKGSDKTRLTPTQARDIFRKLWKNESVSLKKIYPFLRISTLVDANHFPTDKFFWQVINVPPSRFTPLRFVGGQVFEHEQRTALNKVLAASQALEIMLKELSTEGKDRSEDEKKKLALTINQSWLNLQSLCNVLFDSEMVKMRSGLENLE